MYTIKILIGILNEQMVFTI